MLEPTEPSKANSRVELRDSLYGALREIAGAHLNGERANHTLQPTALVNEAWLRLRDDQVAQGVEQGHFLSIASQAMRRILVDHARKRASSKRGGRWQRVTISDEPSQATGDAFDVIAIHEILEQLEAMSKRQAQIIELRFFGGLSTEKTSEILGISPATTLREWRTAQAWLLAKLEPE